MRHPQVGPRSVRAQSLCAFVFLAAGCGGAPAEAPRAPAATSPAPAATASAPQPTEAYVGSYYRGVSGEDVDYTVHLRVEGGRLLGSCDVCGSDCEHCEYVELDEPAGGGGGVRVRQHCVWPTADLDETKACTMMLTSAGRLESDDCECGSLDRVSE